MLGRPNPRILVLLLVILVPCLFLLSPYSPLSTEWYNQLGELRRGGGSGQLSLARTIQENEARYQKSVRQRAELIKTHGPTPEGVKLFPGDEWPWPPYTVYDFFPAAFNCPFEVERIGRLGDGGKWMCGLSRIERESNCVVYSVGINGESSFEAEVLNRAPGCQVWGYDFSVDSFGPEINFDLVDRAHFFPYAMGGVNREGNPNADAKHPDSAPMFTLSKLMEMNGHDFVDILKVDIEKYEFDTFAALIREYKALGQPLPFGQLQLEIHAWDMTFAEFLNWWEALEEAGLRPFWTEPNLVYANYFRKTNAPALAEYSFLNIKNHKSVWIA